MNTVRQTRVVTDKSRVADPSSRILKSGFACVAALAVCIGMAGTASGQNEGTQDAGDGGLTQIGLDPDTAFEGGIERSGAVGSSSVVVGSNAEATQGGAAGGNLFGGGGFGGAFGNAFGSLFGQNNGSANQPTIRTRLRSAVKVEPLQPAQVSANANRRFTQLSPQSNIQGVRVRVEGRTAILTGSVASEEKRRMSELMMRLEPGISRIDNQLQISDNLLSAPQSASDVPVPPR